MKLTRQDYIDRIDQAQKILREWEQTDEFKKEFSQRFWGHRQLQVNKSKPLCRSTLCAWGKIASTIECKDIETKWAKRDSGDLHMEITYKGEEEIDAAKYYLTGCKKQDIDNPLDEAFGQEERSISEICDLLEQAKSLIVVGDHHA